MSLDMAAAQSSERVCYVRCNFCNTILAVSVPCSSLYTNVTVRCGHCANLLSVNMAGTSLQTGPPQDFQGSQKQIMGADPYNNASSSSCASFGLIEQEQPSLPPIRHCHVFAAPEKRQRVPSAYNKFIKEEIQRIKADNPEISHREAFSTAAKNWAHFPHINWLKMDGNKRAKSDQSFTDGSGQKSNGFY